MYNNNQTKNTGSVYLFVTALAVVLSWLLHELAHWMAGSYLGYDMAMTMNTAYALNEEIASDSHARIISAAGPLLTLVEASVIFLIMQKKQAKMLYAFLFTCFYSRFLACLISFLNPNDEARISQSLGIGTFTLPLLVTAFLFLLLYKTSALYGFGKKFNLMNLGFVILFSSLIILGDQFFKIRLL